MFSRLCFRLALNVKPPYIPPSLHFLNGNVPWEYIIAYDFTRACGYEFSLALIGAKGVGTGKEFPILLPMRTVLFLFVWFFFVLLSPDDKQGPGRQSNRCCHTHEFKEQLIQKEKKCLVLYCPHVYELY